MLLIKIPMSMTSANTGEMTVTISTKKRSKFQGELIKPYKQNTTLSQSNPVAQVPSNIVRRPVVIKIISSKINQKPMKFKISSYIDSRSRKSD